MPNSKFKLLTNLSTKLGEDQLLPFQISSPRPGLLLPPAPILTFPLPTPEQDAIGAGPTLFDLSPLGRLKTGASTLAGLALGTKIVGANLARQAILGGQFKVLERAIDGLKDVSKKFGENPADLLEKIRKKGKMFKDLRISNKDNISVFINRPDGRGFIRATFDPDGKTLKSVGLNQPNHVPNLIKRGDIEPLK